MTDKTKAPEPGQDSAFFAVAGVMPDGTLREIGGTGEQQRTWPSVEAFHKARGWKAGTLVYYFPADLDRLEAGGAKAG